MNINVWAESRDVPGQICSDARLQGGAQHEVKYPGDSPYGQAGWDMGLKFENFGDLGAQLSEKRKAQQWVQRLGIHMHGSWGGLLYVEGQDRPDKSLTAENLKQYRQPLSQIGLSTVENATILFLGCLAGNGEGGTRLLEKLSLEWPGRMVVTFVTIGYVGGAEQLRAGQQCTEPGMRDTDSTSSLSWDQQRKKYGPLWKDLEKLPWASEKSKHARIARNGKIVRNPEEYAPPAPIAWWMDKELAVLWKAYQAAKKQAALRGLGESAYSYQLFKFRQVLADRDRKGVRFEDPPWQREGKSGDE